MGRASRSKRPSVREEARRQEQAKKARGPIAPIFNPQTDYRVKYDIQLPAGVFRSPNPIQKAGSVVVGTEQDLARAMMFELISAYGYADVGRAVSGLFAEIINVLSMPLRNTILMQIAQGTGLDIVVEDITTCVHCGAEQEEQEILDPHKPEGEQLTTDDVTVHQQGCPTQPIIPAVDDPQDTLAPEWRSGPAVRINHPPKFPPVIIPQPKSDAPSHASNPMQPVAVEIEPEQLDKVLDLS